MPNKFYGPDYVKAKYGQAALDAFEEDFGANGWDRLCAAEDIEDAEEMYEWSGVE